MEILEKLNSIVDTVKKRAFFVVFLPEKIKKMDGRLPVVVGREAIELYTRRNYTTGDIDLTAPKALLEEVLKSWNFIKKGRVRFNKTLDIYIDWLAEDLDEGKEAEERVNTILIGENIEIRGISIED